MKHFAAFMKKEFAESAATFRLFVLPAIFLLLGMMGPLFAQLMPAIMEMSMGEMGFIMEIPEPTAMDSWALFFGNVGGEMGMGTVAIVISFCGIMSAEFSRGTLINLLTKGLKRPVVVLAKFLTTSVIWTLCYLLALGVCFVYTAYFWEVGELHYALFAFGAPWLFGILILALLIFGGTISGKIYGGLICYAGAIVIFGALSFVPNAARFNPGSLGAGTFSLLDGTAAPADFLPAAIICAALIVVLIAASVVIFNKKKV